MSNRKGWEGFSGKAQGGTLYISQVQRGKRWFEMENRGKLTKIGRGPGAWVSHRFLCWEWDMIAYQSKIKFLMDSEPSRDLLTAEID